MVLGFSDAGILCEFFNDSRFQGYGLSWITPSTSGSISMFCSSGRVPGALLSSEKSENLNSAVFYF